MLGKDLCFIRNVYSVHGFLSIFVNECDEVMFINFGARDKSSKFLICYMNANNLIVLYVYS